MRFRAEDCGAGWRCGWSRRSRESRGSGKGQGHGWKKQAGVEVGVRRAERGALSNLRDGIPGKNDLWLSPIYDLGQASRYNCDMGRIDSGRDCYLSPMLPISYLATLLIKHQPCNGGAAGTGCWKSESLDHRHGTGMNQAWTRRGPSREKA
jgi:hypothetical protein